MGALFSIFGFGAQGRTDDPDPVTGLTSRDIYLIRSTWGVVRQKPTENGMALFIQFFKNNPTYQSAFPFRDIPLEKLSENRRFQAHANSVVYGLSSIVDAIDNGAMLVAILNRVGESHAPRKIPEKSFYDLKDSTIELFSGLFKAEEVAAWKKALDVAIDVLAKSFRENQKH